MGYVSKNARRDTTKKIVIKTVVIMPRRKPKRQTTYQQRYNALSALEVHTIGKVQHIWTLCVLHLKMIEQLIVVCLVMEEQPFLLSSASLEALTPEHFTVVAHDAVMAGLTPGPVF